MTIETEDYQTRALMKIEKENRNRNGWRALHTDFINNKELDGYHVTFVNGLDDPDNAPDVVAKREAQRLENIREEELRDKLKNRTISQPELLELLETIL